jgi:hypothetical protein
MAAKWAKGPRDDGLDMAAGVLVGVLVGLAFWLAVLIVCAVIA